MKPYVVDGQMIVDVAKGIEEDTLMTLSQQISQEIPQADVAVLSGPTHAEEVGRKLPTSCVIGAKTKKTAEYLQSAFNSKVFRVYTSPDMLGIELGGSLKNVIALAAGIADGLGYGDNTKAALITRGIVEIGRLGVKMGGKFESFCGLTGIGDLIVTCASVHSRNRKAGYLMGQGKSMEEAMKEVNMVVEGVYSAKAAAKLTAISYIIQINTDNSVLYIFQTFRCLQQIRSHRRLIFYIIRQQIIFCLKMMIETSVRHTCFFTDILDRQFFISTLPKNLLRCLKDFFLCFL